MTKFAALLIGFLTAVSSLFNPHAAANPPAQSAAAASTITQQSDDIPPTPTLHSGSQTSATEQPTSQTSGTTTVVEQSVVQSDGTTALTAKVNALAGVVQTILALLPSTPAAPALSPEAQFQQQLNALQNQISQTNQIGRLANITVSGVTGLTAGDIPDLSGSYLSTSGGTVSGSTTVANLLTVSGDLTVAGSATLGALSLSSASSTSASSTNLYAGNAVFGAATTSALAVTSIPSALLKTDAAGTVLAAIAGEDYVATTSGDWAGTFDGYNGAYYLATSFSTTSAAYWQSQNNFFSTTSASYFLAQNQNEAFSTTSAAYFVSQTPSFLGGFLALASSTIGNGVLGLTVDGSATTTGNAYFAQKVGVGTNALTNFNFAAGFASAAVADSFADQGRISSLNGVVESSSTISLIQSSCGSYTVTGLDGLTYATVLGEDGNCWLATNLGTTHVPTSYSDSSGYGNLYQWGRAADGSQFTTSATTNTLATTIDPDIPDFILSNSSPYDWVTPQDNNLWGDANRTNNVCPAGWHVPSQAQWATWSNDAGLTSGASSGNSGTTLCGSSCLQAAYNTNLKLPAAGYRDYSNGSLDDQGSYGYYWSGTVDGTYAYNLSFYSTGVYPANGNGRAYGFSVRCIQGS